MENIIPAQQMHLNTSWGISPSQCPYPLTVFWSKQSTYVSIINWAPTTFPNHLPAGNWLEQLHHHLWSIRWSWHCKLQWRTAVTGFSYRLMSSVTLSFTVQSGGQMPRAGHEDCAIKMSFRRSAPGTWQAGRKFFPSARPRWDEQNDYDWFLSK